jgi:hypothetical protein
MVPKSPQRLLQTASLSSSAGNALPAQFHPFNRLPTELRLRIWSLSLPDSRIVPIRCGSGAYDGESPSYGSRGLFTGCTSPARIPAALHACAESRDVALETYSILFGFARGPGQVVFHPKIDVLFFGARTGYMAAEAQLKTCMSLCAPADLAAVRRVAISDSLFSPGPEYRSITANARSVEMFTLLCSRLVSLEEIIIVAREDDIFLPTAQVLQRMEQQVQTSMDTISRQYTHWEPPSWCIQPSQAFNVPNHARDESVC